MVSVFLPQCLFCDHVNPAAAKFCNECGEPLHLKPCKQCEAINDRAARTCYQCGIADPALDSAPEAAATTPLIEPPEAMAEVEAAIPDIAADERPKVRVAAALPPLVLLGALAVSAYYVYSHPAQLREWLGAARATAAGNSGDASMPAPARTVGVAASPAPTASEGTASFAAGRPAQSTAVSTPVNVITTTPIRQDSVVATGVANVGSQVQAPSATQAAPASQSQASTLAQTSATGVANVENQAATPNPNQIPPAPQPHTSVPAQTLPTPQASHVDKKTPAGSKSAATKSKKPPPKKKPPSAKATTSSKTAAKPVEAPKAAPTQ
jgi:hypothetical protein